MKKKNKICPSNQVEKWEPSSSLAFYHIPVCPPPSVKVPEANGLTRGGGVVAGAARHGCHGSREVGERRRGGACLPAPGAREAGGPRCVLGREGPPEPIEALRIAAPEERGRRGGC